MIKHNFRQLTIWKDAISLSKEIYALIQTFPSEHKFGLSSQMFRAAVSIAYNIAEGTSRNSQKEFSYFFRSSLGPGFELETQLIISKDCSLTDENDWNVLTQKVQILQKQIAAFVNTVEANQ